MRLARVLPRVLFCALSFSLVLAVSCAAFPQIAAAQQDVVKLAEKLNKKSMEDYDMLEFDSARQSLQSAIQKLREAGQDETPTAAKVYISLGMVYISGFKDRARGIQQFVSALKIDGTAQLDPERATPELQEAFDEAQKSAPRPKKKAPPPKPEPVDEGEDANPSGTGATGGEVHGLQHESVDEAKEGATVVIKARMGSDVAASRLFLFYRGGQEDYVSVPMAIGRNGEWTATIPGDAVTGRTVQYYIEARDSKGRPAIASGSAASPYIIAIAQSASRHHAEENPLEEENRIRKEKRNRESAAAGRGYGRMFMNLMVGTGIGLEFQGNAFQVAYQYHNADSTSKVGYFRPLTVGSTGLAFAPIHGALEVGVNINRHIGVSIIGQLQSTLINNADSSMGLDVFGSTTSISVTGSGMARFRYNFGSGKLWPSVHVGLGGGYIYHVLDVTEAGHHEIKDQNGNVIGVDPPLTDKGTADKYQMLNKDPAAKPPFMTPSQNFVCPAYPATCYDNVQIGYILVGAGFSLYYDLAKFTNGGIGLIVDTDLIFGLGDQTGMNFDIQLGLGAHFL